VTGFEGIVICRTEWLNKCVRITIQPPIDAEGKVRESLTVDEEQVAVLNAKPLELPRGPKPVQTGGDRPNPAARRDPR
jgi:hypothetical protein